MAAISMSEHPINLKGGVAIPGILEGTLLAYGSDGGGNYSLMTVGTADNQFQPCTDVIAYTAAAPIGFIQEHSATLAVATDEITVYGPGCIVWAVAGAAVTKGVGVMSEAATQTGRVVTVTDGYWCCGIALGAASAEDDMIPVLVQIFQYEAT